jgi:hypothetical protein
MNINNDSNLITSGIIFNSLMISSSGATAAMGVSESFYTTSWDQRWSFIAATAYCYSGTYANGAYLSASYNMDNYATSIIASTFNLSDSKYVFLGTTVNTTITLTNPYDGKYVVIRRTDTNNRTMTIQASGGYYIIPIGNSASQFGTITLATNSTAGNLTTKLVCWKTIWYEV